MYHILFRRKSNHLVPLFSPLERKFFKLKYKFLLFDLDHTLLDFDAAEDIALTRLLEEEEGVEDIQAYKNYYVPMNKSLWKDLEQKKITKAELINTRFAKLFAHFGIEKDGSYLAERYQFFLSKQGQTFPGVEDLLKNLIKQGYELYAATNGITYIQTGRLEQSGIAPFFKKIFISEQLHTQKPDAAFYEKIGARIPNFDKNHALMIGDSLSADIQGGNNAGIDTIWYNPQHLENTTQLHPTYEVHSYQEILEILDKL